MNSQQRSLITAFGDEISTDLHEQLSELNAQGVEGLDLRTVFGKNVSQITDDEADRVALACQEAGLRVHAIGSPINKVQYGPATAEEELSKLARVAEIAQRVGTRRIRIFSPETDGTSSGAGWPEVKALMRPMVDLAEREGLVLMHENDGTFFGAFVANCQRLLAEFGGPHFRAIYDPGNAQMIDTSTMGDWFPWLLPHLDTIHVKDALRAERRFVYAGQGDGQFVELFTFLRESGWNGPLTIEPHANMHADGGFLSGRQKFGEAVKCLRAVLAEAEFAL